MKPIWIERILQPSYGWRVVKRKFWRLVAILHPFDNVSPSWRCWNYVHLQWLSTLSGVRGWRTLNGKLTYFED